MDDVQRDLREHIVKMIRSQHGREEQATSTIVSDYEIVVQTTREILSDNQGKSLTQVRHACLLTVLIKKACMQYGSMPISIHNYACGSYNCTCMHVSCSVNKQ